MYLFQISKEEQEKQLLAQYKEAVEIGVKLLDTHFEEVQLPPNSDSDEEEVSAEYVSSFDISLYILHLYNRYNLLTFTGMYSMISFC